MKPTIYEQIELLKSLMEMEPEDEIVLQAAINSLERLKLLDAQEPVAWIYQEGDGKAFCSMNQPSSFGSVELSENEVTVTPLITKPEVKCASRKTASRCRWSLRLAAT